MKDDIRTVWRVLRPHVKNGCTFAEIKDIVGASGLPVERLSHLQQKSLPARGATKSELLDAIDILISREAQPAIAMQRFLENFVRQSQHLHTQIRESLQPFGWTIEDGCLRPLDFQVEETTHDLSEVIRQSLQNAYFRYSQCDYAGAMTSICSAVDSLTLAVYEEYSLGNPHDATYQQRVSRSFQAFEKTMRARLQASSIEEREVDRIWGNYKAAVSQSAYVLGSFRRNVSDVHGCSPGSPELVRHAIDCGTFIIRSIASVIDKDVQQIDGMTF